MEITKTSCVVVYRPPGPYSEFLSQLVLSTDKVIVVGLGLISNPDLKIAATPPALPVVLGT